ncbi:MAG: lasso peptide biosynthesis B2 protein [Terriglobales bacterium]
MGRLRKFLALPGIERSLLIKAAARQAWISAGLRVLPFSYWRPRLKDSTRAAAPAPSHPVPAERVVWAVATAARYVPGATCLVQALAAQSMMSRIGFPAQVRIGVRAGEQSCLEAHAWLVLNGQVILGESPGCPHVPLEKPADSRLPVATGIEAPVESTHKASGSC